MKAEPRAGRANPRKLSRLMIPLLIGLLSGRSWATTSDISTEVHCPALSPEVKAEFEARAQVDLSLRSAGGGQLEVVCDGLAAQVSFRPRSGKRFDRVVPRAASPAALVDALLVAVAELAADAAYQGPTPENQENGAAENPANQTSRSQQDAERRGVPASGTPMPLMGGATRETMQWPPPIGLGLGAQAGLFRLTGMGLATIDLTLAVGLPERMVASVAGNYGFGLGTGGTVTIRTFGATAILSRWWGAKRVFELGAGFGAGSIIASASPPYEASQSHGFVAGVARVRYALEAGAWRFSAGPEFRVYGWPTSVELDGARIWDMPVFTAAITLDAMTRLYGRLW